MQRNAEWNRLRDCEDIRNRTKRTGGLKTHHTTHEFQWPEKPRVSLGHLNYSGGKSKRVAAYEADIMVRTRPTQEKSENIYNLNTQHV